MLTEKRVKTMAEYIERQKVIDITAEMGALETQRRVQEIPAADVAKVVHAKWVNPHWLGSTSVANCSACNFEAQHREYRGVQNFYKYCPGCNAKMDLED